jgi:hypothetical protein
MAGVIVTVALRIDNVDALSILLPFVIFVLPPIVLLLYRSFAVLDRDAGTVALWRRIVVSWRARTIPFDGDVRVDWRRQRSRDGEGVLVGDVWIGDERMATLKPERAQVVADAIRAFFDEGRRSM